MSVLIDTSVWIDHFRNGNATLVALGESDLSLIHLMVLGEIACGTPPAPRSGTLANLGLVQRCTQASTSEILAFIEQEKLYGAGGGWVDISLLASVILTPGGKLWTFDKRLIALACQFGVSYTPPPR